MWVIANSTGFIMVPLNLRGSLLKRAGANLNIINILNYCRGGGNGLPFGKCECIIKYGQRNVHWIS